MSFFDKKPHFSLALSRISLMIALLIVTMGFAKSPEKVEARKRGDEYLLLGLVGYNYTDRYISEYSVEGASGGYVRLSSDTGGGSGTTCCIKIRRGHRERMTVKVRWQVDGCTYMIKNDRTGQADKARYLYYKEAEVEVLRRDSGNPEYIETHFYPDGSVKVQLTEDMSYPVLLLDRKRTDKSSFPRCRDDKNPGN